MKGGKYMILLNVKVQCIYYQTEKDELGISYATSEKRITIAEAEDILTERQVQFKEVLKVKYEFVELQLPLETFEKHILL